jgi:hypothetical protein
MKERLDTTYIEGMKIREIRERFDREEVSINIIQFVSPRSGELLQSPRETKEQVLERVGYQPSYHHQTYSEEKVLWELPLDRKVRLDITSGDNEGGTKNLNVGNITVDQGEIWIPRKM